MEQKGVPRYIRDSGSANILVFPDWDNNISTIHSMRRASASADYVALPSSVCNVMSRQGEGKTFYSPILSCLVCALNFSDWLRSGISDILVGVVIIG